MTIDEQEEESDGAGRAGLPRAGAHGADQAVIRNGGPTGLCLEIVIVQALIQFCDSILPTVQIEYSTLVNLLNSFCSMVCLPLFSAYDMDKYVQYWFNTHSA